MDNNNYILMGLPESGKTTYLAALWHIVHTAEIKDSLHIKVSSNDMEYLNRIRNEWLSFKSVSRNVQHTVQKVTMHLTTDNNESIDLTIPDCSGEIYRDIFETRTIEKDILELIQNSNRYLFFINQDLIVPSVSILDEEIGMDAEVPNDGTLSQELVEEHANIESKSNDNAEVKTVVKPIPFKISIKKIPTGVVLVDIFQILQKYSLHKSKVAIIISAWDRILSLNTELTPMDWLKNTLPIFHQYLNSNKNNFDFAIYGISAQGGDYTNKEELKVLKSYTKATERIKIQEGKFIGSDITIPLKWLLKDTK